MTARSGGAQNEDTTTACDGNQLLTAQAAVPSYRHFDLLGSARLR